MPIATQSYHAAGSGGGNGNGNIKGKLAQHHLRPIGSKSGSNSVRRRRVVNRRADVALIVILVTLSAISMIYCIYSTSRLLDLQNYHSHMDHLMTNHIPHSPVPPERLKLERQWQRTVKSCLPTLSPKVCGLESDHYTRPGGAGSAANAHRVALIAPPGDFSQWIFTWISNVIAKTTAGSTTHMHIELLSHVPPYSHGFAKVVRILPKSLLLGASDALRGTLTLGKTQQALRFTDLKAALRLLLRYHCRISQMASHTPVFTLEMAIVSHTPRIASQGLLNFLNISAYDHGERDQEDLELEDHENSDDIANLHVASAHDIELREMSQSLEAYASSLLTWIQKSEHVHLKHELNQVLQDELESSNDFSECHSFWTVGEGDDGIDMSVFTRALATKLVPDCTLEKCTHPRDFCEEKGDAVCGEKPAYPVMVENGMQIKARLEAAELARPQSGFVKNKVRKLQQPGLAILEEAQERTIGKSNRNLTILKNEDVPKKTAGAELRAKQSSSKAKRVGDIRQNNMRWSHWAV